MRVFSLGLLAAIAFAAAPVFGAGSGESANQAPASAGARKDVQLTIHMHYWNTKVFDDNWEVFKIAAADTGVSLKGTAPKTGSDSKQIFNLMMASGEIPDIVHFMKRDLEKYALEGAFLPLNDLIDKHAPNIKKFLDSRPDIKRYATAPDGKIYAIPFVYEGNVEKAWFIRKDWLDKLGLGIPKTVAEYRAALKAMVAGDPNGNGKADEVGFFNRQSSAGTRDLLPLFGVYPMFFVDAGKIKYGAYVPGYRRAMVEIAEWYKDGLIDREISTRGNKAREILLGDDIGASTHDWLASTGSFNDKPEIKQKAPKFEFAVIPPPADINGKVWEAAARAPVKDETNAWAISAKNKNPIETIKYFDYWFTEKGRNMMNFGILGTHYEMSGDIPMYKQEILRSGKKVGDLLAEVGAGLEIGMLGDYRGELQSMNEFSRSGVEMYVKKGFLAEAFPPLSFTAEEKKVLDARWTALDTFIRETRDKWTLGAEPVEANFDKYLSQMRAMGMDEVLAAYQSAYDRYMRVK